MTVAPALLGRQPLWRRLAGTPLGRDLPLMEPGLARAPLGLIHGFGPEDVAADTRVCSGVLRIDAVHAFGRDRRSARAPLCSGQLLGTGHDSIIGNVTGVPEWPAQGQTDPGPAST